MGIAKYPASSLLLAPLFSLLRASSTPLEIAKHWVTIIDIIGAIALFVIGVIKYIQQESRSSGENWGYLGGRNPPKYPILPLTA
jgi:hypothetical protein